MAIVIDSLLEEEGQKKKWKNQNYHEYEFYEIALWSVADSLSQ